MVHLTQRLYEWGINLTPSQLGAMARECRQDTAVILCQVAERFVRDGNLGSNGEYVVLIVRDRRPVTIMFRRSNQPMTPQALRVEQVIDRSKLQ